MAESTHLATTRPADSATLALREPDDTAALEAGLDALDAPPPADAPSAVRRVLRAAGPPLVAAVTLTVLWQAVVALGWQPPSVLPGPGAVWSSFLDGLRSGAVGHAVSSSLGRGLVGFGASLVAGTLVGLLLAQVRLVRDGLGPLLSGMQSLPSVAWVPAAILWFGAGDGAAYAVVVLSAVPSIANGLLAGVDQVPRGFDRLATVLGASRLEAVRFVTLPAALPGYLAGLRQGWAFSWRALMAAELIAPSVQRGQGLGVLLDAGRRAADMPLVLAAILLILLVGIAVEVLLFRPLERRVLRQRGLEV
ncbi:MAG TPA: ABC transporter permease [Dermatophilaceae bacterium]|nr:ABC transporter permease [Dermatophilaceae bacterium]